MQQEYKEPLPLYKELDANRTQGEWFCDESEAYIGCDKLRIAHVRGSESISFEQNLINAKFLSLASKNFVKLGNILEECLFGLEIANKENPNKGYEFSISKAKEILKDIS